MTKLFELLKDGTDYGVKISYIEEKSSNGTADSLKLLKGRISANFLVVYGDVIFNKISIEELWNDHIKKNAIATIMLTTSSRPSEKGTVRVEGNKVLTLSRSRKNLTFTLYSPLFLLQSPRFLSIQEQALSLMFSLNWLKKGF